MNTQEATTLIQSILDSIKTNPAQFQFNVTVSSAGAVGIGGPGGPGIVGISNGGGVGFQASASAPTNLQIQIAQEQASAEMHAEVSAALKALESIVQELKSQTMTEAKRDGFIGQLKSTLLPNAITTIVGKVLDLIVSG